MEAVKTAQTAADVTTASRLLEGVDLSGRVAIVTGASSGVGEAIAASLAGAGADVVLVVRDAARGEAAAARIRQSYPWAQLQVELVDLSAMDSVQAFVRRWGERPIHLLINNAGLMAPPLSYTGDGFESQMAVNYFAPMLMSTLLAPNLAAVQARVVTVSSGSHHLSTLKLSDLNYRQRPYDKFEAYGHSKWCANLLAVEFSRRYAPVTMNVVTPGAVATNLARHMSLEDAIELGWIDEQGALTHGPMRTPDQGAASPVWAAIATDLAGRGGLYIEDMTIAPRYNDCNPACSGVAAGSLDAASAKALWERASELLAPWLGDEEAS